MQSEGGAPLSSAPRTDLVHEVLAPTSRELLIDQVSVPPALAIDLGCGPGVSTRFLAEVTAARLVAGLDESAQWIALAQRLRTERLRFFVHDVTRVLFPVGPADLLYSRLLLTHLPDPASILARWATQLRPGGQLLLEEVERIESAQPSFRQYLELVGELVVHESKPLYVGPRLAGLDAVEGLVRTASSVKPVVVENATAARLFGFNLQSLESHPFLQSRYTRGQLETLEQDLQQIAEQPPGRCDTVWSMQQIAYQRR